MAGFIGVILIYAALRMVGIPVEPELAALALVGLTVVSTVWILRRPAGGEEELRETLRGLSERVDRLSKLLEE